MRFVALLVAHGEALGAGLPIPVFLSKTGAAFVEKLRDEQVCLRAVRVLLHSLVGTGAAMEW
jgi:hypothetical protein